MLTLHVPGTGHDLQLDAFDAVVAGYTARDQAAVDHHIQELACIGVPPPPRTPMFYRIAAESVTTAQSVEVSSDRTSGEVEPVYIRHQGRYYLGLGSDHTDRQLETEDIGRSKRACPKPMGLHVLPLGDLESFTLAAVAAQCHADGELYQVGSFESLREPREILPLMEQELELDGGDYICFGGTIPLRAGTFRYATEWELTCRIQTPGSAGDDAPELTHRYTITKEK